MDYGSYLFPKGVVLMFFGILPFALGLGIGSLAAPRYVPSMYPYPVYAPYPYPYPYRGWY